MRNDEKFMFFRVFTTIVIIFFVNLGTFIYKYNIKINGITGFSIKSDVTGLYSSMPSSSKIFLIVQWALLVLILLYTSLKDKGVAKRKKELVGLDIKRIRKDSKTDLDALYEALKEKKELSIITIQKTFKINKKLAMEWAKILESGNLAYIDYPRFGGVSLKLKEHKKLEEKNKNGKDKKDEEDKKHKKNKESKKPKEKNKVPEIKPKIDRKSKKEIKRFNKKAKKIEKNLKKQIKK